MSTTTTAPTTDSFFLKASRVGLRFVTRSGHVSTEDLWALSLKDLDAIAVAIDARLKATSTSFLENAATRSKENAEDELRLNILKAIIEIRQDENRAKRTAAENATQKAFLEDLLARKVTKNLEELPEDEIRKRIAALGAV